MGEQRTALILILILCFAIVSISQIGMVKADESIFIRADGNVEGTDLIQRVGNVYTFTDDISTGRYTGSIEIDVDGIIIERDNIVIDGAGYTLQAIFPTFEMGAGIILWDRSNVTIKNLQIKHYGIGISIDNSSNSDIHGNKITANAASGFSITNSSSNIISGNSVTPAHARDSWHGMCFSHSSNNIISENNIRSSINVWDNGVYGNYWDDYIGVDNDGNGIGDTPYIIDENNIDRYPLMEQYVIPEFPSWIILPLFMAVTLLTAIVYKRLLTRTSKA